MKLIFCRRKPEFDEWLNGSGSLKEICQVYFWNEHDIFLNDGGSGFEDDLYEFTVMYNDFHHCYRFVLIGSTCLEEKVDALIRFFKKRRYKISPIEHTWAWKGKQELKGLQFDIEARNR